MADLKTVEKIEAWINARPSREEAIEHLRKVTVLPGILRDRDLVLAYLAEQERLGKIERDTAEHDFMRRQTVAAEASAEAARASARWAAVGAFIAVAALIATAWPYFKLIDALQKFVK